MAIVTVQQGNRQVQVNTNLMFADAISTLRGTTDKFAQDLLRQHFNGRELSPAQRRWVFVKAQQALDERNRPQPLPGVDNEVIGLSSIFDLFQRARLGLQYPKIRLELPSGEPVVLALATGGKYEGSIRVTNGRKYGEDGNVFHGVIQPDGVFQGRNPDPAVVAFLRSLAADPAGVAARYGRSTGNCCFCGLSLTNGEQGSVEIGYGPVCASKWGLPWHANGRGFEFREGASVHSDVAEGNAHGTLERLQEARQFMTDQDFSEFRPVSDEVSPELIMMAVEDLESLILDDSTLSERLQPIADLLRRLSTKA